jgi:hypothetical protein
VNQRQLSLRFTLVSATLSKVTYFKQIDFNVLCTFLSFLAGLIPKQRMRVEILWTEPKFNLWQPEVDTGSYQLVAETAVLHVEVATLSPQVKIDLERKFEKHNIKYRYIDMICLTENIGKGSSRHISLNLTKTARTPLRVFIAFVKSSAFNGHKNKNPLYVNRSLQQLIPAVNDPLLFQRLQAALRKK